MRINKDSLKARANNIAKKYSVSQNIVYDRFFFDAFLARLAASPYKDSLVLKGGIYLSSLLGIENRSTVDIDFYGKHIKMEQLVVENIIKEISSMDINDGITFTYLGTLTIREDDQYGGFQISLRGKLENVREDFSIDVATGDPIVPSERNFEYKCLVTEEVLPLKAYSLETIVSEKLQTILSKSIANSRSKDYYDLYILEKTQKDNIDITFLKKAFEKTCNYRKFSITKENALELLSVIENNEQIQLRWRVYSSKNKYANVNFAEVVKAIRFWVEQIYG